MRPSQVEVILRGDFLSQRQPSGVVLPLVEVRKRGLAGQSLKNHVDDGTGQNRVLDACLHRPFIDDTDRTIRSIAPACYFITGADDFLVQLVRQNCEERTRLVDASNTEGVAKRAVGAILPRKIRIATRAIGLTTGVDAVVAGPVLTGSEQCPWWNS